MAAYHSHTNRQVESYNKTAIACLRHYIASHQCDWDIFVQPFTYAYNKQAYLSTDTTPFSIVHIKHPPRQVTFDNLLALAIDANQRTDRQVLRTQLLPHIKALQTRVKRCFKLVQERYKQDYDTKVCSTSMFKSGRMVYIDKLPLNFSSAGSAERLATTSYNKFIPKVMRPFPIVNVQPNTLTIDKQVIYYTVSIDSTTFAPGNKAPSNASQRTPVEEDPSIDLDSNGQSI